MRVLLISAFPPDPAPEANHALHLSEQLAKLGHTVHVLCKNGSIAATHPNIVVHPVIEGLALVRSASTDLKVCASADRMLFFFFTSGGFTTTTR